jgi:hypothetical protein
MECEYRKIIKTHDICSDTMLNHYLSKTLKSIKKDEFNNSINTFTIPSVRVYDDVAQPYGVYFTFMVNILSYHLENLNNSSLFRLKYKSYS